MKEERRQVPRTPLKLPVRIKGQGMIRWAETLTQDFSRRGFRCTMYGAFWPIGSQINFEMPLFPAEDPMTGLAHVIHMGEIPYTDRFYVGLQFSELSSEALRQLERFLTQQGLGAGPSRAP